MFTILMIKKYQWWRACWRKNRMCRLQSADVLYFERKSPCLEIIVVITNFLQNGKPHSYRRCKRVSLLPKILATKTERKTCLPLRDWKSLRSICYNDSERKLRNCGTLTERSFKSNKIFLRSRSLYVLQVVFRALSTFPISAREARTNVKC